jgi:hypothetical protein
MYSVIRSDGFGYPGEPGGPIGAEDGRRFYETWKNEIWLIAISTDCLPLPLTCTYGVNALLDRMLHK